MFEINESTMSCSDAIAFFEALLERTGLAEEEQWTYNQALNTCRLAVRRMIPLEPKYQPGRVSKKYDSYTCRNCGFGVNDVLYIYCPNCGQKLTRVSAAKRVTAEEEARYCTPLMAKDILAWNEEVDGGKKGKE